MVAKKNQSLKPTGVNKGIKEGIDPKEFQGRVICKKCGKDIEFTLGSELFLRCPRCKGKIERDIKSEGKEAEKIIKFDLFRRSKKYLLQISFVLTSIAIAYNITGFFCGLFEPPLWWLALMSLPLVAVSYVCAAVARKKSAAKRYRIWAWVAVGLIGFAIAAIVVTVIPDINEKLMELYRS